MTTILIVEDQYEIRELLKDILVPEYQVVEAISVAQAIETARNIVPDLILLDLSLEGHRDGLAVCEAIRNESDPGLAGVPIVMLTAETIAADIRAALAAGANSCIGKPYHPHSLSVLIDTLLIGRGV